MLSDYSPQTVALRDMLDAHGKRWRDLSEEQATVVFERTRFDVPSGTVSCVLVYAPFGVLSLGKAGELEVMGPHSEPQGMTVGEIERRWFS